MVSKTKPVKKFVQQQSTKTNETEIQKPKEQKNEKPRLPKRKLPPLPPPEHDIEMG
jgi:hypothetical protein